MEVRIIDNPLWKYRVKKSIRIDYNMPLQAEFQCDNCGHREIHIREISDEEIEWLAEGKLESEDCPKCHDSMIIQIPPNPVLVLEQRKH